MEFSVIWRLVFSFSSIFYVLLAIDILCQGGFIDDFLSHLMCCCCALVQERREVEIRGVEGMTSSFRFLHTWHYLGLSFLYLEKPIELDPALVFSFKRLDM